MPSHLISKAHPSSSSGGRSPFTAFMGRRSVGRLLTPTGARAPASPRRRHRSTARRHPATPGRMTVPRAYVEAAPLVDLGLGGGEEGRRRSPGRPSRRRRRGRRSSRLATEATARPTRRPVRWRTARSASAAGRPVARAMAVPEASASRHPRAPHAADGAVGLDDDVADVAGVAVGAVEQPTVEDDPAPDAGRHHHGQVVPMPSGRAEPALPEGQGLGVVVDGGGQAGVGGQPLEEREALPGLDVHRGDRGATPRHRPPRAHPTGRDRVGRPGPGGHLVDEVGQCGEEGVTVGPVPPWAGWRGR